MTWGVGLRDDQATWTILASSLSDSGFSIKLGNPRCRYRTLGGALITARVALQWPADTVTERQPSDFDK